MCKKAESKKGLGLCRERLGYGLAYSILSFLYAFMFFAFGNIVIPFVAWCIAVSFFGVGMGLINSRDKHRRSRHYWIYCLPACALSALAAYVGAHAHPKSGDINLLYASAALIGITSGFVSDRWGETILGLK